MQDVCTDAEMLALLKDAQRGVPAAYDRLYNLYVDKIFHYVYARLGQRETAEDLTADVFVRLVQVLPRFRVNAERPVASFSAWLYRIASNLLIDHHRRQQHRQHADLADHVHLAGGGLSPDQHTIGSRGRADYHTGACRAGPRATSGCALPLCRTIQHPRGRRSHGENNGCGEGAPTPRPDQFAPSPFVGDEQVKMSRSAQNLEAALAACLDDLQAGMTHARCLERYPEYADQLEALLLTAERLQGQPWPTMSTGGRARGRERMHAALASRRPAGFAWWSVLRPLFAAVVLLALAGGVWLAWPGRLSTTTDLSTSGPVVLQAFPSPALTLGPTATLTLTVTATPTGAAGDTNPVTTEAYGSRNVRRV